jgi:uncharacterized membrane protein
MKKLIILILLFNTSMVANAQGKTDLLSDREFMFDMLHSTVATIALCITITFILSMVRLWMNYQLRKKLLDNDAPIEIIDQILLNKSDNLNPLKWCIIMVFVGIGLFIVSLLGTLDIRSLMTMSFSIALGFGAFYFISQRLKN